MNLTYYLRIQLVLRKSSSGNFIDGGFGFTLCGRCPAIVGRVDPGTPAARAGLVAGDLVERINGRNVSRSSADSVATIVRLVCYASINSNMNV